MVDGRLEQHGGRRVRVGRGEHERELEGQRCVRGFGRACDGRRPREQVRRRVGERGYARCGVEHELHELVLEASIARVELSLDSQSRVEDGDAYRLVTL